MHKYLSVIPFAFLFSSCATIMNNDVQKISITAEKQIKVVSVDSSLKIMGSRNSFYVERSKNPIKINLQVDTVQQKILVKPYSSVAYWSNIYFNYGIGMLADKDNLKRYAYPKRMYLHQKDNNVIVSRFAPILKGSINWHIALPHLNFFRVKTIDSYRISDGFWGIESGIDYYYKDNRFVSVYCGTATDFFVPVPAAVTIRGEYQSSTGIFVSARNNLSIGSFNLGYGLAYSKLYWRKTDNSTSPFTSQTKNNSALGLSTSSSYRFGELFHLGLLYQPYFIRVANKAATDYQYQISIELIWKIPVKRIL